MEEINQRRKPGYWLSHQYTTIADQDADANDWDGTQNFDRYG